LLVAGLVAGNALLAAGSASAASQQVTVGRYLFTPDTLTVSAGDTVTWVNRDPVPHAVAMTQAPVAVAAPVMSTGNSWSYTFTVPGTYYYFCSAHPDMRGSVTVQPVPGGAQQIAVGQSTSSTRSGLDPMLVVGGIVAAVTILCLLLIGSRPERS
jgi:plastocyanin